jgi:hypothetical protein
VLADCFDQLTKGTITADMYESLFSSNRIKGAQMQNINESRGPAAGGLGTAASALHEKADSLPGGEKVANAAHTAADALGSTADYLRENGLKGMLQDVQKLVKNNPGPALLTAAVLGFLLARTFSRD